MKRKAIEQAQAIDHMKQMERHCAALTHPSWPGLKRYESKSPLRARANVSIGDYTPT
jgi:hypothetical protein